MSAKRQPSEPVQLRRPRGRPKAQDLAALEARLVVVARQLFFTNGYGATTMSAVASVARVSKTTLYARFASKAALFRAIVAEQIESWDTGLHHTPMEHCDTLEETLQAYGDVALRAGMTADFIQLNRLIYSESERFPELGEIADARFRLGAQYLAGHIRAFAERDDTPCRDPDAAAELFLMTLVGWSSVMVVGNRVVQPDERKIWLHNTVRTFLAGRSNW